MKNETCQAQKGFAVVTMSFFILVIMLTVILSVSFLVLQRKKTAQDFIKSTQSYYGSESGLEDALLRLADSPTMSSLSYKLNVGEAKVDIVIADIKGSSRNISSTADNSDIIKKTEAVYATDAKGVSFFYGAQAGEGGIEMSNNSVVKGNVFSNGSISGKGIIENDAIVTGTAKSVNTIEDTHVKGGALTPNCKRADIDGNLTYVSGGSNEGCAVGGTVKTQSEDIASKPLPISQEQIDNWKAEAGAGGIISGNVEMQGSEIKSLGPAKITGDLIIKNQAVLTLKGTLYVAGKIATDNNAIIKLDSGYGSQGGVLLADGEINVGNNVDFQGSGHKDSHILVISTKSGSAITVNNKAKGAIFYTSSGTVLIKNNVELKAVSGYKIKLDNNAIISYETGLANSFFSGGPSEKWGVISWEEK